MSPLYNGVLPDNDRARWRHILRMGFLFYALPIFAVTNAWRWHDTYGWHAAPTGRLGLEVVRLLIGLALWTTGGYFFARRMWYEGHAKPTKEQAEKS